MYHEYPNKTHIITGTADPGPEGAGEAIRRSNPQKLSGSGAPAPEKRQKMAKRRKFTDDQIEEMKRLRDEGMPKADISKRNGISIGYLDVVLGDQMSQREMRRFAEEWNDACWAAADALEARRKKERRARIT